MVIASVYERILDRNDALHSRDDDFMQGITYGNPCRKEKSIAPGCTDPGGWGINVNSWLQKKVDSRWWDFANFGDPAACNGAPRCTVKGVTYDYHGSIGVSAADLFLEMYRNFSGDLAALIAQLGNPPPNIVMLLIALFRTLLGAAGPHTTYDKTKPDSTQPSLTCTQLAANQLTSIATSLP